MPLNGRCDCGVASLVGVGRKEKEGCLSVPAGELVRVNADVYCEAWGKDMCGRRGLPHRHDRVYVGERVGKSR